MRHGEGIFPHLDLVTVDARYMLQVDLMLFFALLKFRC